jgi:hypothetical protein
MNTYPEPKNQLEQAASWILKSLYTNTAWFDEIRLAGRKNFERKYHYIPLIDISLISERFDISILKDACYLLKNNNDVDIWGDDFEPYGMLVQLSDKGINSYQESRYYSGPSSLVKKGLTGIAALIILTSVIVGIKKSSSGAKPDKKIAPAYNKKISETIPKATAFLELPGDN